MGNGSARRLAKWGGETGALLGFSFQNIQNSGGSGFVLREKRLVKSIAGIVQEKKHGQQRFLFFPAHTAQKPAGLLQADCCGKRNRLCALDACFAGVDGRRGKLTDEIVSMERVKLDTAFHLLLNGSDTGSVIQGPGSVKDDGLADCQRRAQFSVQNQVGTLFF